MSWDLFQGAIPGQSLTKEMGSAPHDLPPQYADVNDALEHIFDLLTTPRQVTRLVLMLKKGVSAEYIARSILFVGFAKGKWTPDVSLMSLKIVIAMIVAIASQKGVKATIFNQDKDQEKFLDQFLDIAEPPAPAGPDNTKLPDFTGVLGGNL